MRSTPGPVPSGADPQDVGREAPPPTPPRADAAPNVVSDSPVVISDGPDDDHDRDGPDDDRAHDRDGPACKRSRLK